MLRLDALYASLILGLLERYGG